MKIKTRWAWKYTSCDKRKLKKVTYESLQICGKKNVNKIGERYIASPDSMALMNSTPRYVFWNTPLSTCNFFNTLLCFLIMLIYSPIIPWLVISFLVSLFSCLALSRNLFSPFLFIIRNQLFFFFGFKLFCHFAWWSSCAHLLLLLVWEILVSHHVTCLSFSLSDQTPTSFSGAYCAI